MSDQATRSISPVGVWGPPNAPRARLLEAALDLFARQGFRGTSVKEVTVACGLTQGALYNHFSSKDDLLYEIVRVANELLNEALTEALDQAPEDPPAQLRALTRAFTLTAQQDPRGAKVASFDYVELPEELRADIVDRRRANRRLIEGVLTNGVSAGDFSFPSYEGGDPVKMVATAIANLAARISELHGPVPPSDAEAMADFHAELVLRMVSS